MCSVRYGTSSIYDAVTKTAFVVVSQKKKVAKARPGYVQFFLDCTYPGRAAAAFWIGTGKAELTLLLKTILLVPISR